MPLPRETGDLIKKLKSQVDNVARHFNIAPEVLGRKKDLTALVSSGITAGSFQLPPAFRGWRKNIVGDELLKSADAWKSRQETLSEAEIK